MKNCLGRRNECVWPGQSAVEQSTRRRILERLLFRRTTTCGSLRDLTLNQERWRPPRLSGGGEWSVLRLSTTQFGQVHQERVIQYLWIQRVRQYPRSASIPYISRKAI
ncbi:hypothetical protein CDAR_543181 [Caerostris darwini]|uniref:Uncharacterized protein n=1 Tax=Caerostris darwini TaxID=1538125 RepID=A0AAV4X892_9ARAC|nr:hypothetical protein CDAR_543181 [Caerostris darwini]